MPNMTNLKRQQGRSGHPYSRFELALLFTFLIGSTVSGETPALKGEPVAQPNGALRFTVEGEFRPSLESARESALRTGQERLREWLAKQNPPIRHVPSLETIRREMNPREFTPQREQIPTGEWMHKMTMEFDLQPQHIRDLRERDRVASGMWTLGGILAMLGILVLLFRIDEWTKGFLTRWLFVSGILLSVALFSIWWWGQ